MEALRKLLEVYLNDDNQSGNYGISQEEPHKLLGPIGADGYRLAENVVFVVACKAERSGFERGFKAAIQLLMSAARLKGNNIVSN